MTAPKIRLAERTGGLAAWSIHHPIGVVMITLAVMVLGLFALGRLGIDLLPHIIYPEVRVRVSDPGVPAKVMEDQVTRQLEEQLAITENAIYIQSRTREGSSSVDLSFAYGTDIDQALRDASTRLDRAKRFLPTTIEPPVIYKWDPSQRPVAEYAVSSPLQDPVELRGWVDYTLGKWLVNLPGVAAAEVGGGLVEEIQVLADQQRLAGLGLDILDIGDALEAANKDVSSGRLELPGREISGRTAGRFKRLDDLIDLPITAGERDNVPLRLGEVARVIDGAEEERLRIRLNGVPGVKLSIQKQPRANTVNVVEEVQNRVGQLQKNGVIPPGIEIHPVDDEARYVRQALDNAVNAAASGALLAMLVVYLFLGSVRRTLIIGSAIPIAILVTFILMSLGGLTLNIMTLGGLALGIGMLVDSTIVMLENIYRHQRLHPHDPPAERSRLAAAEVNSAIVASTTTNLAAVLPFLFIGGLVGLLFRELIFTISAAILASLVVALTLVPALAGRTPAGREGALRRTLNRLLDTLQAGYGRLTARLLRVAWLVPLFFIAGLAVALPELQRAEEVFLPKMDEGRVSVRITAEQGISLARMDEITRKVESIIQHQPEVESYFTQVGGFVFGRSTYEATNRANIQVILKPIAARGGIGSEAWIARVEAKVREAKLVGAKVRLYSRGIRGIRMSQGDDDITLRILGPDLETLERLAAKVAEGLRKVKGLRNVWNTAATKRQEIAIAVDRERAASFGLSVEDVGRVLKAAIGGIKSTDFIKGDRSLTVRLRLEPSELRTPADLASIVVFSKTTPRVPLHLGDVAKIRIVPTPSTILRVRQQRAVEINTSQTGEVPFEALLNEVKKMITDIPLPPGYSITEAGSEKTLTESRHLGSLLLGLALFLVFVVMAVQYESLRNPLVIILSVPFAVIGVALGLWATGLPVSMPVWLGLIMLTGIVVNNAIVLVEYIEVERSHGRTLNDAIVSAARLRLRPILMTTLTTVVGMLPLALAWGEGSEMLQPLAVAIVSGLLFSTLVSLVLVPAVYRLFARERGLSAPALPGHSVES